jgi:hypothetical protein
MRGRVRFHYPPVAGVAADLMLVTRDHADDSGVEGIERSTRSSSASRR